MAEIIINCHIIIFSNGFLNWKDVRNRPRELFDSCEFQRNFLLELWPFVTTLHYTHTRIKLCIGHIMPCNAMFHAKSNFQQPVDFLRFKARTELLEKCFHSDPRVWWFPLDRICLLGSSWAKQIPFPTQDNTSSELSYCKYRTLPGD